MKLRFYFIALLLLTICSHAHASKTAIFDYDDRLDKPDTIAHFIENKLKEIDSTIVVDQYSGKGDEVIASDLLKKLDESGYNLIITITTDALILAQHFLRKTPTIYTNVNNPLFLGFKSLDAPGGNISGASYYVPIKKQISFFKKIQPGIKKLGFIFDRDNKSRRVEISEVRYVCDDMKIKYELELISEKEELPQIARSLIKKGADAIVVTSSGKIYNNVDMFISLCYNAGVPVYSFHKKGVENGAIAALASDYRLMAEKLVIPMALKVLRKRISPGNFPVAFLDATFIYINLTKAKEIRLSIPDEIIKKATQLY